VQSAERADGAGAMGRYVHWRVTPLSAGIIEACHDENGIRLA